MGNEIIFYSAIVICEGNLRLSFWFGWRPGKIHYKKYPGLKDMIHDYTAK